ncbi:nitrite reductase small subunit NirD [Hwanghaeella sp.]|jgi:nitrite reductase (NADH) small subunit|uniref:nitrite reductase small subunit NirD n=1 Tax=Hwanghaeella sp. TaxID=2605943 RepID=UPI003CCBEE69
MMDVIVSDWIDIGALDEIPVRGARKVKTPIGCVAVFRTIGDEVFALLNRCPHKNGPLSEGIVHGRSVTCPLHNWVIALDTGEAQGADSGSVPTIRTRIEDRRVLLDRAAFALGVAAE